MKGTWSVERNVIGAARVIGLRRHCTFGHQMYSGAVIASRILCGAAISSVGLPTS